MAKKIIIDCDPGIDDALAILFAYAESAQIKAITTAAGNVGVEETTGNLLNILALLKVKRLPRVGKGSEAPLCGRLRTARHVHGKDGLGNSNLPPAALGLKLGYAADVLAETIRAHPGITVVATGPLTNIAKLFLSESDSARNIGRLVVMGGALRVPGNISRFAEFNIAADPEAAAVVMKSGVPVELISLDMTHKAILNEAHLREIKKAGTAVSDFIVKICGYSIAYHKKNRRVSGMYLHDPLAMGIALHPELGMFERLCLGVKLDGRERGRIYMKSGKANVIFYNRVNIRDFFCVFLKGLSQLAARKGC